MKEPFSLCIYSLTWQIIKYSKLFVMVGLLLFIDLTIFSGLASSGPPEIDQNCESNISILTDIPTY